MYAACNDGYLYAFAAVDGSVQWRYSFDESSYSPTVPLVDGLLYYADLGSNSGDSGTVHAVKAATGDRRWQTSFDHWLYTPTIVEDGVVYVGGDDEAAIHTLDAESSDHRTDFDPAPGVIVTFSIVDGVAYAGDIEGYVSAFDTETGTKIWHYRTAESVNSSTPTVANGRVYFGNKAGVVHAVDAETGKLAWQLDTGDDPVFAPPAVVDGTLFVGGGDRHLWAIDATEGTRNWRFRTESGLGFTAGAAVVDGTVYVPDTYKYLHAVAAESGEERWKHELDTNAVNTPALSSDTVYVPTAWSLYAIKR